jgi:hypothetical protein
MNGQGGSEGHTARTWWNAMTITERRAAIAQSRPNVLYATTPYMSRGWDRLPLSQKLIVQQCFDALFRSGGEDTEGPLRSE